MPKKPTTTRKMRAQLGAKRRAKRTRSHKLARRHM